MTVARCRDAKDEISLMTSTLTGGPETDRLRGRGVVVARQGRQGRLRHCGEGGRLTDPGAAAPACHDHPAGPAPAAHPADLDAAPGGERAPRGRPGGRVPAGP